MEELEKLLIELWKTQKLFAEKTTAEMVLHPEAIESLKKYVSRSIREES